MLLNIEYPYTVFTLHLDLEETQQFIRSSAKASINLKIGTCDRSVREEPFLMKSGSKVALLVCTNIQCINMNDHIALLI